MFHSYLKQLYVAESESSQIIGFANAGIEREENQIYRGELYAIYIEEDLELSRDRDTGREINFD